MFDLFEAVAWSDVNHEMPNFLTLPLQRHKLGELECKQSQNAICPSLVYLLDYAIANN